MVETSCHIRDRRVHSNFLCVYHSLIPSNKYGVLNIYYNQLSICFTEKTFAYYSSDRQEGKGKFDVDKITKGFDVHVDEEVLAQFDTNDSFLIAGNGEVDGVSDTDIKANADALANQDGGANITTDDLATTFIFEERAHFVFNSAVLTDYSMDVFVLLLILLTNILIKNSLLSYMDMLIVKAHQKKHGSFQKKD